MVTSRWENLFYTVYGCSLQTEGKVTHAESCLTFIQLISLLLRIFPALGRVIHLCLSQHSLAWWHMTASVWVSTDWLISPLVLPLRDNGNEWQHGQTLSGSTCYISSVGFVRSTAPLPLRAHVLQDTFLAATIPFTWPYLHLYNIAFWRCCDESASWV